MTLANCQYEFLFLNYHKLATGPVVAYGHVILAFLVHFHFLVLGIFVFYDVFIVPSVFESVTKMISQLISILVKQLLYKNAFSSYIQILGIFL